MKVEFLVKVTATFPDETTKQEILDMDETERINLIGGSFVSDVLVPDYNDKSHQLLPGEGISFEFLGGAK